MKTTTMKKNSRKNIFFLLQLFLFPLFLSAQSDEGGLYSDLFEISSSEYAPKLTDIVNLHLSMDTVVLLTLAILVITIIMHIIRRTLDSDEEFEGLQLPIFTFLFVTMCIFELTIAMSGINPVWFCSPNDIGWFMTVIGFFFFVYILYNQLKNFRILMDNITIMGDEAFDRYGLSENKYLTGVLSGSIGIVLLCLSGFLETGLIKNPFWLIAAIMVALQIFQAVIIYRNLNTYAELFELPSAEIGKQKRTIKKYIISFVYLIGILATIVTMIYFISLLFIAIVIVIGWVILFLMGKAHNSMRSSIPSGPSKEDIWEKESTVAALCSSCSAYPGHKCHCSIKNCYVDDYRSACNHYRF